MAEAESRPFLRTFDLERVYKSGPAEIRAVDGVSMNIRHGEFLCIVGASGSGKSTLLNLLAGLDTPTGGRVEVDGVDLAARTGRQVAAYRAERVGMVFQSFHLMPHMTARENVELALYFTAVPRSERRGRAEAVLSRLGLAGRMHHPPSDLSGGEQQRTALARALVKEPDVLFADEPTGNLDHENTDDIAGWLGRLSGEGLTVVLATHDLDLAERHAHRTVRIHYGKLEEKGGTVR